MYSNYGSYGYDSYNTASTAAGIGGVLAGLAGVAIFFGIVAIAAAVLQLVAQYKMFKKAGKMGYEALIPGHNTFALFQMAGINPIWVLGIIFGEVIAIIPILGSIAYLAFIVFVMVWLNLRLAKTFGKETGFGVLMFFFPYVMYPILAFGSAKYTAPKKMVNKPGEDK